ncbi:biopolymer transporter ExbD [bacterium]|nr:biopolymer transporter ExbD [bacterium]
MAIKLTQSENGKKATFNEINITPLTDIFLVLLIIMMVIAPGFQSMDNNITMPEINSGITIEDKKAVVSITKDGEMFLNGEKTTEDSLEEKLVALVNESQEKQVVVRADEKTKSSEILKIMRMAQSAGYEKLTVAGEPLSKKEQRNLKENAEKGAKKQ